MAWLFGGGGGNDVGDISALDEAPMVAPAGVYQARAHSHPTEYR